MYIFIYLFIFIYTFLTSRFWPLTSISNAISLHVNCQLLSYFNIRSHLIPKASSQHAEPSPSLLKSSPFSISKPQN